MAVIVAERPNQVLVAEKDDDFAPAFVWFVRQEKLVPVPNVGAAVKQGYWQEPGPTALALKPALEAEVKKAGGFKVAE